jgi:nucleoside-diphosphate-sugar epimerase
MRILVTGATGFIGRHLCRSLLRLGYNVRGTFRSIQRTQASNSGVEWVPVPDINSETNWDTALRGVSVVVHLAAVAHQIGVPDCGVRQRFGAVNADGTRRLAECVAGNGDVKRLIFMSSIAAASVTNDEATSNYAQSKKAAEDAVKKELKDSLTDWCILRPTLVYGPGNPGNMERLFRLIDTGLPLPFGSIRNKRSFLYVGNLVSAIEQCLIEPLASHRTLCVSDGDSVSTPELIRSIADCRGRTVRLVRVPVLVLKALARVGDIAGTLSKRSIGWDSYSVQRLCASLTVDSAEMKNVLGWHPPFSFKEGLMLTLSAYRLTPDEL